MAKSVKIIPASEEQWPAKETLRAAAYCRVSTACEEQMGSLEAQQQFYASMIEMNPDWSNAGIFSDQATGLNAAKRPGFQAMLRLCRKGKDRSDPNKIVQPAWTQYFRDDEGHTGISPFEGGRVL